jgi:uncharacterized protein YndB with AHSA1/START domain
MSSRARPEVMGAGVYRGRRADTREPWTPDSQFPVRRSRFIYNVSVSEPIVRSVSIQASASDAFDAFTRVSDLLSWWCEGALVGLRPGGNWAIGFTDVRGRTEATVLGKIAEFERGRRLVVREISLEPGEGEALEGLSMVLTFADIRDGCLVTVEQLVPDAGPAYDRYRGEVGPGWEASFADLKKYLEGPRRRRVFVEAGLPEN